MKKCCIYFSTLLCIQIASVCVTANDDAQTADEKAKQLHDDLSDWEESERDSDEEIHRVFIQLRLGRFERRMRDYFRGFLNFCCPDKERFMLRIKIKGRMDVPTTCTARQILDMQTLPQKFEATTTSRRGIKLGDIKHKIVGQEATVTIVEMRHQKKLPYHRKLSIVAHRGLADDEEVLVMEPPAAKADEANAEGAEKPDEPVA